MTEEEKAKAEPPAAEKIDDLLTPIKVATHSSHHRKRFLAEMGWHPEQTPLEQALDEMQTTLAAGEALKQLAASPPETLPEYVKALQTLQDLVESVRELKSAVAAVQGIQAEDVEQFGDDLVSMLTVDYLTSRHPVAAHLCVLLGLIRHQRQPPIRAPDGTVLRAPDVNPSFRFDHLGDLIQDPGGTLSQQFFGEEGLEGFADAQNLLPPVLLVLKNILLALDIEALILPGVPMDEQGASVVDLPEFLDPSDAAASFGFQMDPPWLGSGLRLFAIVVTDDEGKLSLAIDPSGAQSWGTTVGSWDLDVDFDAETDPFLIDGDGVQDAPDSGQLELGASLTKTPPDVGEDGEAGDGDGEAGGDDGEETGDSSTDEDSDQSGGSGTGDAVREIPEPPEVAARIGGASGTRLELGTLGADASALLWPAGYELDVRGRAGDSRLVVAPGDGDGFLQTVLPDDGLDIDFDLGLGWSTEWGVYFEGSAGVDASIPIEKQLGPIRLQELYLGLLADQEEPPLQLQIGLSGALELGPITATVRHVGLEADATFPENHDGNLGPVDVDFGFKPPTGIGVAIEAGAVTGGGFIEHDPAENRYAGALQLEIGEWSIGAFGLLETQLPSGRDGYSFLLMITANDMPPIQLGAGFTLTGMGGLVGTHRGMEETALQEAVRTGDLSNVLFPEDVVENAQTIIGDLATVFPVTEDQFVVGPMVRIGYGTPTLLTMDLAVVLQIPAWKIALLGNLHMALPDEKAPIIDVNLDALGVLDVPGQRFSLDARLYDSRIVQYTVSGEMALRSRWGADARFMMSLGGFHPRYEVPGSFPDLDRIKASLCPPGGNPSLELKGYLAITPNTFQVGAQLALEASIEATVDLEVTGQLGFDALFHFNPFTFLTLFNAQLTVVALDEKLTVSAAGQLSGPSPYHVQATIEASVGPFSVEVDYSETIGDDRGKEELPTSDILSELVEELEVPENWQGQDVGDETTLVMLREPGADQADEPDDAGEAPGPVLVHPLGGIRVAQSLAPLEDEIETFGNAQPATYDMFRIERVDLPDQDPVEDEDREPVEARFPPAQFKKMSDDEKLETPAFVDRVGGTSLASGSLYYGGESDDHPGHDQDRTEALLEFDTVVVDRTRERPGGPLARLAPFEMMRAEAARFGVPAYKADKLLRTRDWLDRQRAFEQDLEIPSMPGFPSRGEVYGDLDIDVAPEEPTTDVGADTPNGETGGGLLATDGASGEITVDTGGAPLQEDIGMPTQVEEETRPPEVPV